MAYTTKITKARAKFVWSPFEATQMVELADDFVRNALIPRIKAGLTVEDTAAKALKPGRDGHPGYPERKIKARIAPIRNWISPISFTRGRIKTLRALKTITANQNRAIIGFIDPRADQIAHINNQRVRQFGVSPNDMSKTILPKVHELIQRLKLIKTSKAS